jgi:hypothetical protein
MKSAFVCLITVLALSFSEGAIAAGANPALSDNAALRYYAAFTVMQDSVISDQEARKLNGMLDGRLPYDDSQYSSLVKENILALELMRIGVQHAECDWGLDYQLGDQTPVEYARKALQLGRLNVLYAFHLSLTGDKDGAVDALDAGLRFSRDVANGGSLFATIVAKQLLVEHLRLAVALVHIAGLSPAQQSRLRMGLRQLAAKDLDWGSAITRELALLSHSDTRAALQSVTNNYVAALKDPSRLNKLEATISALPQDLQRIIPDPKRVIEQKEEFATQLQQARSALK